MQDGIVDELVAGVEDALQDAALVVISDYGKGVVTDRLAAQVIGLAQKAEKPAIVDPKSRDFTRYAAQPITPNFKEMSDAAGGEPSTEDDIVAAARALLADADIDTMLVTQGAQGMSLVSADGADHFPSRAREVFDVSGAGDTVIATLAAGIAAGLPPVDAAQLANVAAGIVVGKTGTAVAYAEDIQAEIDTLNEATGLQPSATIDAALGRILTWRDRGEKVGFTNGCFDLLHPGHVSLLSQARGACDRLVVGLNSDASVKRLKGESRPTQTEEARAAVLSSLRDRRPGDYLRGRYTGTAAPRNQTRRACQRRGLYHRNRRRCRFRTGLWRRGCAGRDCSWFQHHGNDCPHECTLTGWLRHFGKSFLRAWLGVVRCGPFRACSGER